MAAVVGAVAARCASEAIIIIPLFNNNNYSHHLVFVAVATSSAVATVFASTVKILNLLTIRLLPRKLIHRSNRENEPNANANTNVMPILKYILDHLKIFAIILLSVLLILLFHFTFLYLYGLNKFYNISMLSQSLKSLTVSRVRFICFFSLFFHSFFANFNEIRLSPFKKKENRGKKIELQNNVPIKIHQWRKPKSNFNCKLLAVECQVFFFFRSFNESRLISNHRIISRFIKYTSNEKTLNKEHEARKYRIFSLFNTIYPILMRSSAQKSLLTLSYYHDIINGYDFKKTIKWNQIKLNKK